VCSSDLIPSVSRLDRNTSGVLIAPLTPRAERRLAAHFAARRVEKTYVCLVAGVTPERGTIDARLYVSKSKTHFRVYVSPKGKPAETRYTRRAVLRVRDGGRYRDATVGVARGAGGGGGGGDEQRAGADTAASSAAARSDPGVFSLLEVSPLTGRTHQIRAHLASIGHAIVCDTKYKVKRAKRQMAWCPRLFLHASRTVVPMGRGEADDEGCGAAEEEDDDDDDALAPLVVEAPLPDDLAAVLAAMDGVVR
jgi:23S rRNA-/tRNA-specific pseudouridylate synthase